MMVYGHLCLYASAAAVLWPNTMLWRHGVLAIVKALNEGGIAFDLSICFIGLPWHYVGSFHCFIPDSLIHFNGLRSTDLRAPSFINAFNRSLTVLVSMNRIATGYFGRASTCCGTSTSQDFTKRCAVSLTRRTSRRASLNLTVASVGSSKIFRGSFSKASMGR